MKTWGNWKASYTVEAAMVFPILFATLVFLLFLTYYAHDVTVQNAICYETALEAVYGGSIEDSGTVRCIRPSSEEVFDYAQKRILAGIIDEKERTVEMDLGKQEKQVCIEGRELSRAVCEERNTPELIRKVRRMQIMAKIVKEELTKDSGEKNE